MSIITRFDDIDGLYAYFNTHEVNPTTSGTDVVSWDAVYGSNPFTLTTTAGNYAPKFNGSTYTIGALHAIEMDANFDTYLSHDFATAFPNDQEFTVITLQEHDEDGYLWSLRSSNSTNYHVYRAANNKHYYSVYNTTRNTLFDVHPTGAQVCSAVLSVNEEDLTVMDNEFYVHDATGVAHYVGDPVSVKDLPITQLRVLGTASTTAYGGRVAIMAIYDRPLSEVEIGLIYDLIEEWVFTGENPQPPAQTQGTYTCTSSDPDNSTYNWQCNRSDRSGWYPVSDPSNGLSSFTISPDGTQLTVTPLTSADTGLIRCHVTTPTYVQGAYTSESVLTVTETGQVQTASLSSAFRRDDALRDKLLAWLRSR